MEIRIEKIGNNKYRLPRQGNMKAAAVIYLREDLLGDLGGDESLRQLAQGAELPGVWDPVLGMPDIHSGFGLPIGGVMVTDPDKGVVSAGAVGMDINCGVRLLSSSIPAKELGQEPLSRLLEAIARRVPAGVGKGSRHYRQLKLAEVVRGGAGFLVEAGFGREEDLAATEEYGCLDGADLEKVSSQAVDRSDQLATIGGGNHFIEIGRVEEVFSKRLAGQFGLHPGLLTVMIHTGSRGFGHQICSDYSKSQVKAASRHGIDLPNRGLACVPVQSREGQDYLAAMACAVNFAFANRQLITYHVREAFAEELRGYSWDLNLRVVYDVAHNIAKLEEHRGRVGLVHRKGATRALPPGHPDNPALYRNTGHPAIVPGSMGTASYVVTGTPQTRETFYSINHGAGRVLSRQKARETISLKEFQASMGSVLFRGPKPKKLIDEAPQAYKDITSVVDTLAEIGLIQKVARLVPLAVLKGD